MGQSASLGGGAPRTGKMGTCVGETIQTAPPLPLQLRSTVGDGVHSGVGFTRWRKHRVGLQRKALCSQVFENKASLSIKMPP